MRGKRDTCSDGSGSSGSPIGWLRQHGGYSHTDSGKTNRVQQPWHTYGQMLYSAPFARYLLALYAWPPFYGWWEFPYQCTLIGDQLNGVSNFSIVKRIRLNRRWFHVRSTY